MRYLVTGGAGFIAGHLAEHLLAQGHTVTSYDVRHPTLHLHGLTSVTGNVCNAELVDEVVSRHDAVFHLAAVVGFAKVMRDPIRTIETGMRGTQNVVHACARHGKRLVFTSTSAIYGRTVENQAPVAEDGPARLGSPAVRSWCYAYAKAAEECLALAYHQEKKLPVVVVRLFNTVGPRQSPDSGFVLPRFVRAALRGEPLHVHAPGTQGRTFAHVADVVEGLAQLMACADATGEIVNLGGTETVGIYELAQRIVAHTESASPVELVPDPYGVGYENVLHRAPDLRKAERLVGYRPSRTLEDMIADVVAEYAVKV